MKQASKKVLAQMEQAFLDIQMPRTPYMLKDLVVDTKFTPEQKYAQCVLELQNAYDNLRTAKCNRRISELELKAMPKKTEIDKMKYEIKKIELEKFDRTVLGAVREFEFLFNLWTKFPKKYTREELNLASPEEYRMRLETQAQHDILATGRVTAGNLEGLRQIGQVDKYANMINMKQPALVESGMDEIEERYLEEGKLRATIIIPSEKPLVDGTPLTQDILLPTNVELKIRNIHSAPVAENYNAGIEMAIKEGCTHIVTCEDDQVLEEDSIIRLFDFALKNPDACVGAYYLKKEPVKKGVHIHLVGPHRQFLEDDNQVHEVKTLAMGLSIYPVEHLKKIGYPYCKTTTHLSQDSYLSQKLRDAGVKLLVDCSIKIGHKDRVTGKVYGEVRKIIPKAMQVPEELGEMLEYARGKKTILEIGTARGGTLYQFMQVADPKAHFISIDMPDGRFGGEFGQPDIKEMRKRLKPGQKLSVIRFDSKHESTISEVKKLLGKKKVDFMFIDGDHTYEGVKKDYELYKQFANNVIVLHDICRHNMSDVGVDRFWNEVKKKYKYTEIIKDIKQGWAGIGILHLK